MPASRQPLLGGARPRQGRMGWRRTRRSMISAIMRAMNNTTHVAMAHVALTAMINETHVAPRDRHRPRDRRRGHAPRDQRQGQVGKSSFGRDGSV
eukprot:2289691-Rhodomonas_salina.2